MLGSVVAASQLSEHFAPGESSSQQLRPRVAEVSTRIFHVGDHGDVTMHWAHQSTPSAQQYSFSPAQITLLACDNRL